MNTENSSSNNSQSSTRRSSSRRRKGKRPAGQGTQAPPAQKANPSNSESTSSAPSRNSNNRRRRGGKNGKARTTPRLSGFELVSFNYDKVLADHLEARKRYFEMYFRAQPSQRDKLERLFFETLDKLYDFEKSVPEEFKVQFNEKYDGLSKDLVYSERRELPQMGELEIVEESQIEDPHYLESQKSANYSGDTEESVGGWEEYKSYKGIIE